MVELARVMIPLHHAVSYRFLANDIEPDARPEMDFAHQYLRKILFALDPG